MALDGKRRRPRRSDRARRQDRIPHPRRPARARADPPRCRARARRSGADAVARHAGHHRPGDRERLLLRLLPQPAVHAGGFRRHREEDARDHRARQTVHQGSVVARRGQEGVPRQGRDVQGRAGRRHPGRPADQDLQAGRLVRSLPRPAHDLDRQDRQRLQADEGRGRLLARRFQTARCCRASTAPPSPSRTSSTPISSRSRKPRSATTAGSAARWICSISRKKRRARCSGIRRAGRCSRRWRTTSAAARRDAGYVEVNAPQLMDSSLWVASGHMATFRDVHVPDRSRARRTSASSSSSR